MVIEQDHLCAIYCTFKLNMHINSNSWSEPTEWGRSFVSLSILLALCGIGRRNRGEKNVIAYLWSILKKKKTPNMLTNFCWSKQIPKIKPTNKQYLIELGKNRAEQLPKFFLMANRSETMSTIHDTATSDNIAHRLKCQREQHIVSKGMKEKNATQIAATRKTKRNKFENNFICHKRTNNFLRDIVSAFVWLYVGGWKSYKYKRWMWECVGSFVCFLISVDNIYDLLNVDMNGWMEDLCELQKAIAIMPAPPNGPEEKIESA